MATTAKKLRKSIKFARANMRKGIARSIRFEANWIKHNKERSKDFVTATGTTQEESKGYLSAQHIASHDRPAIDVIMEAETRDRAIESDIMAQQVSYIQEGKRGARKTVIVRMSGVDNTFVHPNLAKALGSMKPAASSPRLMYSTKMRNTPFNKRGKHIRPLEIYLKPLVTPVTRGEKTHKFTRIGHAAPSHRRSVIAPVL